MLLKAVLDTRQRVMLEMNVPKNKLNKIVKVLPCMRSPTISPLFGKLGYGVKAAVERNRVPKLISVLKN